MEAEGFWTPQENGLHINILELIAVERTINHFVRQLESKTVLLVMDNSMVVAYLRKQGGPGRSL